MYCVFVQTSNSFCLITWPNNIISRGFVVVFHHQGFGFLIYRKKSYSTLTLTSYLSIEQYCGITDLILFFSEEVSNEFPADIRRSAYQSQRHLLDRFVRERPREKSVHINHADDAEIQFWAVQKLYINNLYPWDPNLKFSLIRLGTIIALSLLLQPYALDRSIRLCYLILFCTRLRICGLLLHFLYLFGTVIRKLGVNILWDCKRIICFIVVRRI